jgi:hypothetical protein
MNRAIKQMALASAVLVGGMASGRAATTSQADGSFFVATNGNDTNPGTLAKPFATLQRAQQAARKAAGRAAVTVFVREGTHYLPETLIFTAEDSGTKTAPVVYQAYQKEQAVISGGVRLKDLKWEPYQNGIMQARVPAGFATDQLFVNGERQPMARYPNFNPKERIFNGYAADAFSPERAARWKDPAAGFIHALHAAAWGGMHYVITGKDADNKVTYEGGWQNNRPMGMNKECRFVENIFEELDAPGEWFLDSKNNVLYLYPPPGVDLATATVEAARLRHLVEFRGTEHSPVRFISFKGLTFRHAARTFMDTKEPLLRTDWAIYRGGALFFNGTEDCTIENCLIDQVGGNAVFVNNYNRRVSVRGCHIAGAGGNGVAFIGDPNACYNPVGWNQQNQLDRIDKTPGPKTSNYPGDCVVDDCLIHNIGEVEKQTAGVTLDMAMGITIRHCSIYDMPRAGINFGDGCWGGHVIEFCDVFDTVKETGDHGSFNSWGRDRYWGLGGIDLNNDQAWETNKSLVILDAWKTTIIRNSRWRCDHGWDIDLDDGSSNYRIYNNLCLRGGLKNREGFYRVVENNIMIDNQCGSFHPHCWYKHSEDVVRRNIWCVEGYMPAGGMPATPWGKEMDYNLVHYPGLMEPIPALNLAEQSKRDAHSILADAMFVDPDKGDFRVKEGSPALKLGFVNFPMDQFGVQKPELKAIARTPEIPKLRKPDGPTRKVQFVKPVNYAWQARIRDISGLGERSAYGLPDESGVLLLNVPAASPAAKAGLQKDDVIIACNGQPVRTMNDLQELRDAAAGDKLTVSIIRKQKRLTVEVGDYAYVVAEYQESPDFKVVPLAPAAAVLPAKRVSVPPGSTDDPFDLITDGKLERNRGHAFRDGVTNGAYKIDLGSVRSIARVNTFSRGNDGIRARQNFVLYGSAAASDPGWNVEDASVFTPIIDLVARETSGRECAATSIRQNGGKPLGRYRWLIWAVTPITYDRGSNTTIQELQVIPARGEEK